MRKTGVIKGVSTNPVLIKKYLDSKKIQFNDYITRLLEATKAGKFYEIDERIYVSNVLEDIIKSVEESLKRLKKSKLELLFLHDYEAVRTKKKLKLS